MIAFRCGSAAMKSPIACWRRSVRRRTFGSSTRISWAHKALGEPIQIRPSWREPNEVECLASIDIYCQENYNRGYALNSTRWCL